ncbi:MAG: dipeptide ABC transporter ATP-binding protein [Firmicutes bacterium]|nr:dipeptide ABC transporter ATP-binding protein [Bacillota bacterium]
MEPLITVRNLKMHYPIKKVDSFTKYDLLKAVDGISFDLFEGETLGLVGESGCGKSTTRKLLLNVEPPTSGEVCYRGDNIYEMDPTALKEYRRNVQAVYQDPYSSLNPKWKVLKLVSEPLIIHKIGNRKSREEKVRELLSLVGLREQYIDSFAHEFSGGQRQRISIARALALDPQVIIADEPVSALDVSIQAQVINLFKDLKDRLNLTYIFISHDLNVVKHISDRVAVMYLGKIVEIASGDNLFDYPKHPYTKALIKSIPVADPEEKTAAAVLRGEIPSPIDPPPGCAFHTRCPEIMDKCRVISPDMINLSVGHQVACHLYTGDNKNV